MRSHGYPAAPRRAASILAVTALLGAVAVVCSSPASRATSAPVTAKQQAFHDGMRKLWEDHTAKFR
jgi:hypothetical protein